ncbi:type IV pilus secretin PilQ [bacterium]|nr:type IV pilus secretin PilQ [bacterium]MCI0606762.1 type IV pilus secretin PilQ [bacterium]
MSKRHYFPLFLLLFSFFTPPLLSAEDLVGLKNLSWEEQKNKTRIVLETTQPLQYNVTASQTASEVQVELTNLDLRNLPQELFINTPEVVSLQTFPQADGQRARIVVKLTSFRPHQVSSDGNKLYIDIEDGTSVATIPAPPEPVKADQPVEEPVQAASVEKVPESAPVAAERTEVAKPVEQAPVKEAVPASPATVINDVQISPINAEKVDVVLVGDGSMNYDVFELANPARLVIDVKSVSVGPGLSSRQADGQELLTKVRVAQFQTAPKVVRAVIDLNRKVPYTISQEGTQLTIHLGEANIPQAKSNGSTSQSETETAAPVAEPVPVNLEQVPVKYEEPKIAQAEPKQTTNEQFFSFEPDTSLFAQETTTLPTTSRPPTETTGSQGMGSLEDREGGAQKQYTGEPFSFDFKDIDIKDLFRFIADISGLNVILDPSVRGSVTLKLTEVPWDQALDLITKNQGLGYTIEGNVIRIAPLSKIEAEEEQRRRVEEQQFLSAPLVTKIVPLSYAKAQQVDAIVKRLLTKKGSSIVDVRTNTLIITDIDTNIDSVISLIDTLDSRTSQVVIETRIVETTKNFSQGFGIQWGFRGIVDPSFGNNTTLQFPNNMLIGGNAIRATSGITGNPLSGYAVNLPSSQAPNSAILLSAGNILDTFRLDVALMALENSGQGRILSSPKVATQNNTRAEIVQGTQIPVQTIANNTITTTYVQASLRMSVLPQITAEGTVIMEVEIENNRPNLSIIGVGGTPAIDTESARTTLLVEDGGTTVIGGIFTASESYQQGRTPVLHRIPLLGWLFKNTNVTRDNRELLIFLTPRIIR